MSNLHRTDLSNRLYAMNPTILSIYLWFLEMKHKSLIIKYISIILGSFKENSCNFFCMKKCIYLWNFVINLLSSSQKQKEIFGKKMFLPPKFRYQFAVLLSVFLDSEFMLIKEIFISHSKNMEISCDNRKSG